ncbi:MAG TPA: hypothetical protein VFZ16_01345 [Hyphomicrobiaceae bacterium]|nr:hypothetical protein [Hyphomicrobiaceae bacterium]
MNQHLDRPKTATCAKGTLSVVTRFGGLLMVGVFASTFFLDFPMSSLKFPMSLGRASDTPLAQPYVPASDHWITLGGSASEDQPTATSDAAVIPEGRAKAKAAPEQPAAKHAGHRPSHGPHDEHRWSRDGRSTHDRAAGWRGDKGHGSIHKHEPYAVG